MKNKKIIIISIIIFFLIISYFGIQNTIGNYYTYSSDSEFYEIDIPLIQKLKHRIPQNVKNFLKETIFVFKNQQVLKQQLTQIENLKDSNQKLIENKNKILQNIPNLVGYIPFVKEQEIKDYKINNQNYNLTNYKTNILFSSKWRDSNFSSYIDYFDNKLFLVTANGIFSYVSIKEFDKEKLLFNVIKSNIKDLIQYDWFYLSTDLGIKDLLIHKNKIYISYSNQMEKDCFNTSIFVSDLNVTELKFENFFTPKICAYNDEGNVASKSMQKNYEFSAHHSGGRMFPYKDNKILFSIGEYRNREYAQDKSNVLGKIISIDIDSKEFEIISMGHRNPQGLFYDAQNNIIFSSEHGPEGGDEINIITPGGEIENYGWPISSYGEHYGGKIDKNKYRYEKAPLYNSHKDYGFIEPLKYFIPSIAPSEIIKLNPKFSNSEEKDEILVASMGDFIVEGDLSLHHFILNKDFTINQHTILTINERIRDMIYVEEINKIFLFLESASSIGVLSKYN